MYKEGFTYNFEQLKEVQKRKRTRVFKEDEAKECIEKVARKLSTKKAKNYIVRFAHTVPAVYTERYDSAPATVIAVYVEDGQIAKVEYTRGEAFVLDTREECYRMDVAQKTEYIEEKKETKKAKGVKGDMQVMNEIAEVETAEPVKATKAVSSTKHINTKVVIEELHRAFRLFNEKLYNNELPEPAILIQSRGARKLTLGWCTVGKVWKNDCTHEERYEINLVAEALNRGIYPVMSTLLHEMVHLYHNVNEIKGTSRGNTYHNKRFKADAEAHGLIVDHAEKIGWSVTRLTGATMNLIDSAKFDEAVFSLARLEAGEEEKPKKKATSKKYVCPICGQIVRATKEVNILCANCTNIEEGIVVRMIEEVPEDKEPVEDEPKDLILVKKVCSSCGCEVEVPKHLKLCPECDELSLIDLDLEEDTVLDDGAGNPVPVKQRKLIK